MARSDPAMRILARELDQASLTNSDLHKKIERLTAALIAAKCQIITLHPRGDQRRIEPENGDSVNMAVLDQIDDALKLNN